MKDLIDTIDHWVTRDAMAIHVNRGMHVNIVMTCCPPHDHAAFPDLVIRSE